MSALLLVSCSNKKKEHPFQKITFENISRLQDDNFAAPNNLIRMHIDSFRLSAENKNYIDVVCNQYYDEHQPYLWINRSGTGLKSDTLINWIEGIDTTGIPSTKLFLPIIRENLQRLRNLDFDQQHPASKTMAALEYYLTKSFLRYSSGQRFGFTNPNKLLNSLDHVEKDSTNTPFRRLFNIPIESLNKKFLSKAFQAIRQSNLDAFLASVQPQSDLYSYFVHSYNKRNASEFMRRTLAINIERSRWRFPQDKSGKYVLINIPTQELKAVDAQTDSVIRMKICYGQKKFKTPLLISQLTYMEVNPYWIIPSSIVRRDIIPRHLNDTNYYNRRQFKIIERSTGNFVSPLSISAGMLQSGKFIIRQDRGEDNSLGKIIFRFPNPFTIYLHDTNNREAFGQSNRAASHGCIRLEKPFELASFIFSDKDEVFMDKIRLTINIPPVSEKGKAAKAKMEEASEADLNPHRYFSFSRPVPLFIIYFTAYPDDNENLIFYPDIYGYDGVLATELFAE